MRLAATFKKRFQTSSLFSKTHKRNILFATLHFQRAEQQQLLGDRELVV